MTQILLPVLFHFLLSQGHFDMQLLLVELIDILIDEVVKLTQNLLTATVQLHTHELGQESALEHHKHSTMLRHFALVAEAEIQHSVELHNFAEFFTVFLANITTKKRVLLLQLFDIVFNFDILALLQLRWMLRIMIINLFRVLLIDGAVLERDFVLLLIQWVPYSQLLEELALEVLFVDALDQVFSLQREELPRLFVEVLLDYVEDRIVEPVALRQVLLA